MNSMQQFVIFVLMPVVSMAWCCQTALAGPNMPSEYILVRDDLPERVLRAPAGYYLSVTGSRSSSFACPSLLPPYTGPLVFPSKYTGSDRARDTINPVARAEYDRLTENLRSFEKQVSSQADKYVQSDGDPRIRDCLLTQMVSWADADAMHSSQVNEIGMATRKWLLAASASAWLRLKLADPEHLTEYPQQARRVEAWLARLAEEVVKNYSGRDLKHINNHDYWAGWAVTVTSVVLNRQDLFVWGFNRLRIALNEQVTAEGYLPNELRRQTRALLYHNYALQPLTMILVFAEANDIHLTETELEAYRRLAGKVVDGIYEPMIFAQVTGSKQEVDGLYESYSLAWLLPYGTVVSLDTRAGKLAATADRMVSTRLGGNLTLLYKPFLL